MNLDQQTGLITEANFIASPNHDERPEGKEAIEAIIIHCISLPPGEYGNGCISDFFCNKLDTQSHPYFADIGHLTVSSHFVIERSGKLNQYVPTHLRAWHAGESRCLDKPAVNSFSLGIELEGLDTDTEGYTDQQYLILQQLISCLQQAYPKIKPSNIFAHSDIAPGRKTDPGEFFDWSRVTALGLD